MRMMILADDLSGAADCGVVCKLAGLDTIVALGEVAEGAVADVVSLDADTRRLNASTAAARTEQLVRKYAPDATTLLFKKIDSTLRGHLGPEIAAALRARRSGGLRSVAVVAPALPFYGRTTVGGLQHVYGRPLHETDTWRGQEMKGEAHISQMLSGCGLVCAKVDISHVRSGHEGISRCMLEVAGMVDVIVCDAETDEDLFAIAEATAGFGPQMLWVGSAGLARHLPQFLETSVGGNQNYVEPPSITGPVLFVIGSMSRTSQQQVAALAAAGTRCITIPPAVLLSGTNCSEWFDLESELRGCVDRGEDSVLMVGAKQQISGSKRSLLPEGLAQMTTSVRHRVGALVASGGETARAVLDQWNVATLRLVKEIEVGVPMSIAEGEGVRPLRVITKAGDFGRQDTLVQCREALHMHGGVTK